MQDQLKTPVYSGSQDQVDHVRSSRVILPPLFPVGISHEDSSDLSHVNVERFVIDIALAPACGTLLFRHFVLLVASAAAGERLLALPVLVIVTDRCSGGGLWHGCNTTVSQVIFS